MQKLVFLGAALLIAASAQAQNPRVEMKTSRGIIVLELNTDKAPRTAANFVQYARDGHYNGTIFHRVIDGFMVQGGGFDRNMRQKPTRPPIENEAANGLKNDLGSIAMARTADPHSASAQFFINVKDNGFLNYREPTTQGYGYTVFGRVVQGIDVVMGIAKVPTATAGPFQNVPREPIVIESVTVTSAK